MENCIELFPTIFFGVSSIHEARIWNLFSISNKKRGIINHPLGGCSITAYDWLSIEQ